jgi:hypothetical protein
MRCKRLKHCSTALKPRPYRDTELLFVGGEFVFDPESIGEGDGVLVDALLELSPPAAQLDGVVMAVVVGHVFAQPAPQGFDRNGHERTTVIRRTVPHHADYEASMLAPKPLPPKCR